MEILKLRTILLSVSLFLFISVCSLQGKTTITIGVATDANQLRIEKFVPALKEELQILLGTDYQFTFPGKKVLFADWSAAKAVSNYQSLLKDEQIDIIIGLGVLTSTHILRQKTFPKPVITVGIVDSILQGLPKSEGNSSGVHNLSYILTNMDIGRDLRTFQDVYPFRKVGILYYKEIEKVIENTGIFLANIFKNVPAEYIPIALDDGINNVLSLLDSADAVYVGYLGKFRKDKEAIFDLLAERGVATFGNTLDDVKKGALAAIAPGEDDSKIRRRIALNIESYLQGESLADLPVNITLKQQLNLNMKTAKKINFSPNFSTLLSAEIFELFTRQEKRTINLLQVIHEARKANLDLKITQQSVDLADKEVSLAKTDYLPSLNLGANGILIDNKRAQAKLGSQAEKTVNATASVSQLIYSDQVIGNIGIKKHLLKASEQVYRQTELDITLSVASAYFNILRAKTLRKIEKNNLNLIKENLEIARLREVVGYSGRSDVYRWQSKLAESTTYLLSAQQEVQVAKIHLSRLLNRPQNESYSVQDAALSDSIFSLYDSRNIAKLIQNSRSLSDFSDFLIGEAFNNAPELKQLEANRLALDRLLNIYQRKRFIPSAGLGADVQHTLLRKGEGSEPLLGNQFDTPWSVELNISLPIFEGGATHVNIQKSKIEISRVENQIMHLKQFIEQDVRSKVNELAVKVVNLETSKRSAEFAQKSLELVKDSYSKGTVSVVELADAQNNALVAEHNAINSVYDYLLSMLQLERSAGQFRILQSETERQSYLDSFRTIYDEKIKNNQTEKN
jgi:outer membrane protein TolC/ABC-type uncharacterized transport system substrate-binding protein